MHLSIKDKFIQLSWVFNEMTNASIYEEQLGEIEQYVEWLESVIDCLDKYALEAAKSSFNNRDKSCLAEKIHAG